MVFAIRRSKLDDGLASSFPDGVTAESGNRTNICASGAAPHECVCHWTVDGVSAIRSDRAADNDQLRYHGGIPSAPDLLGQLEFIDRDESANCDSRKPFESVRLIPLRVSGPIVLG